jgi:iron complex transport system substrate-binding protein
VRRLALILIAFGSALILAGALIPVTASSTSSPSDTKQSLEITDDHGRMITIADTPERVISLAPSATEILFALGVGDKVVGVTDYCDYPEELLDKIETGIVQKVGAPFPGFNLETIVDLEPDVVFAIGATVPDYVYDLDELGIPAIVLNAEDIDGIFHDIELVGEVSGKEEEAEALVAGLGDDMDETVSKVSAASVVRAVFYGVDVSDPALLWTAGNGTFIDALINLAGGVNIAGDLEGWPTYNLEDLVDTNPDVIVLGGANWGVSAEEVASRPVWQDLDAVKNQRIYAIDDTTLVRPGPRIAEGLELLATLIHPELFED